MKLLIVNAKTKIYSGIGGCLKHVRMNLAFFLYCVFFLWLYKYYLLEYKLISRINTKVMTFNIMI